MGLCQTAEEKTAMLHADDDNAFRGACTYGHQKIAEWLMGLCQTAEEQSAMLHAGNDAAFRLACQEGHQKIAEWLMGLCQTAEEQSAMLHARYDSAFRWACGYGHLETTKWLWGLCQTAEELSAMLHARDDLAFCSACEKGHQKIAEWLMGLCQTAEEQSAMLHAGNDAAFRLACQKDHQEIVEWLFDLYETDVRLRLHKKHVKIPLLWHKLNEFEQIEIFNDQNWLVTMIKNDHSINGVHALIRASQSDDVKGNLKTSFYRSQFGTIITALYALNPSSDEYLNYIKGCKDHNKHYFLKWQMDYLVRNAIRAKNADLLKKVLHGLEPTDLLEEYKLAGWLSLANQEGNTVFQDVYISAVWCVDLYQVLEKDNNAAYYESLGAVIRVLFKHGVSLSTLMQRVMHDKQAGCKEWWLSLFQGVIINMLTEDPNSINNYKHLLESFCGYPLVRYDNESGRNEKTEYQERCLKIISWFESEFAKEADNPSLWPQEVLWKMLSQLCLGCGITFGDNHDDCIVKLLKFKKKLETALKGSQSALDVCLEMGGAGYASDLASASFYPREGKRKAPSGLEDNQDQSGKKQRREDPAVSFFQNIIKEKLI